MPAAAVIPAPRAYTDIAAVKALVVCHWVQVCQVAGRALWPWAWGSLKGLLGPWPAVSWLELNPWQYDPGPASPVPAVRFAPA